MAADGEGTPTAWHTDTQKALPKCCWRRKLSESAGSTPRPQPVPWPLSTELTGLPLLREVKGSHRQPPPGGHPALSPSGQGHSKGHGGPPSACVRELRISVAHSPFVDPSPRNLPLEACSHLTPNEKKETMDNRAQVCSNGTRDIVSFAS